MAMSTIGIMGVLDYAEWWGTGPFTSSSESGEGGAPFSNQTAARSTKQHGASSRNIHIFSIKFILKCSGDGETKFPEALRFSSQLCRK